MPVPVMIAIVEFPVEAQGSTSVEARVQFHAPFGILRRGVC